MARKKSRPSRPAASSTTAIVAQPAVTGVRPAPPTAPPASKDVRLERSWIEVVVIKASRLLGSIWLAVLLLPCFALALGIGTLVESAYSAPTAQELVYRAWWFTVLLGLLWINIFSAAAKKWPWKRHQVGFLITHLGLLIMVAGGILTSLSGTDALMVLVDSPNPDLQSRYGAPQVTNSIIMRDDSVIRVQRFSHGKKDEPAVRYDFAPGSLPWRADEYTQARLDPLPALLHWIAHPWPHSWYRDLGNGAELEVLGYYPHTRKEEFRPLRDDDKVRPFPAVKYRLVTPFGEQDNWIGGAKDKQVAFDGGGMVEIIGRCPAGLLDEFLNPPGPGAKSLGKNGQLVLELNGVRERFAVDDGGTAQPFGKTGWAVQVVKYIASIDDKRSAHGVPYPMVRFRLTRGDGQALDFIMLPRQQGTVVPLPPSEKELPEEGISQATQQAAPRARVLGLSDLKVWFHPADPRWGLEKRERSPVRAVLQLVVADDGKLYYRSYSSKDGFRMERSGEAGKGLDRFPIWDGMMPMFREGQRMQFQVVEFLPQAVDEVWFVPEDHRPGLERDDLSAAIRCKLTVTKNNKKEEKEFWVGKRLDDSSTPVRVGDEVFRIGYNVKSDTVGFDVKLLRAESIKDPGSQSAATYSSYVQLTDKKRQVVDQDYAITMNEPLEYNGYMLYQSGYQLVGTDPENFKPVSRSTFTVGWDPAILWRYGAMKYTGSIMLALGIFTMFYMRSYSLTDVTYLMRLFRGHDRRDEPNAPSGNGQARQEK